MSRSFWAAAHAAVMSPWGLLAKLALCALLGGGSASGAQIIYTSDLYPANGSHVAGNAILTWDTIANTLAVMIHADDLEPNQVHEMHIHGRFDGAGNPIDSVRPTPANDTDADGFVEMMEGSAAIGPVIMPLGSAPTDDGIVDFNQTYNLNNDALFFDPHTGQQFDLEDLFPLDLRAIEIHGKTVASGIGAGTPHEVNGVGGYKMQLPVAAGEIVGFVPEPASAGLLAIAVLAPLAANRRRREGHPVGPIIVAPRS